MKPFGLRSSFTWHGEPTLRSGPLKTLARSGVVFLLALLVASPRAFSLEPPRPGEIEELRRTGQLESRVKAALALGNYKLDPALLDRAVEKLKKDNPKFGASMTVASPSAGPETLPSSRTRRLPSKGAPKSFVLLIDFPDYPHVNDASLVNARLFGPGQPAGYGFPYESLNNYYARSSYETLDLSAGHTFSWWRAPVNRSSIPEEDWSTQQEQLIKDAITYFKTVEGHDFSQYDNDGDGYIDYFVVIWSGPISSWGGFWWGKYYPGFVDSTFVVDGKRLWGHAWLGELDCANAHVRHCDGTFDPLVTIHETGHGLGLPDLYDTNPSVGPTGGVGEFDMMDHNYGDHNCFGKWLLDWLSPSVVSEGFESVSLDPSGSHPQAVLIMPHTTGIDGFGEFYMVQNRTRALNDDEPYYVGGLTEGLLIWHVDGTLNSDGSDFLFNNGASDHKLLRLMEADGLEEIESGWNAWLDVGDFFAEGRRFGDGTFPSSRRYGGDQTGVLLDDITTSGTRFTARFGVIGRTDAGYDHSLLLRSDGSLQAWGYNYDQELGTGRSGHELSPAPIGTDVDWRSVVAGRRHNLAVRKDGTLWAWGLNNRGQLGDDSTTTRRAPVPIKPGTHWAAIAAGDWHSVALKTDGTLWAWGYNSSGQLGIRTWDDQSAPTQIGTSSKWALVAAGSQHNLAIRTDGTLWAWGNNGCGQLGDGTTTDSNEPQKVGTDADWVMAAAGTCHSLAIKKDGTLWAWGNNNQGQLGIGISGPFLHPIQVGSDTDWAMVTADGHSSAIKRDGSLWAWGANDQGQLGGDWADPYKATPARVGTSTDWDYVNAGYRHTLAVKSDATLWDAGYNGYGQLGDGTQTGQRVFRQLMSTLPTDVTLSAVPVGPWQVGARITITGAADGGSSTGSGDGSFEYQFWLNVGGNWSITQDYSTDDAWEWDTTGLTAGTYAVRVHARNSGSTALLEAEASQSFELLPVQARVTLSVSKAGAGSGTVTSVPPGIDCGSDCAEDFVSGTNVTLTATPATGSVFTGWSGACSGAGSCAVSMTSGKLVTATFEAKYTLSVSTLGVGSGTVTSVPPGIECGSDCSEDYAAGTNVTLSASPANGSVFTGWGSACSGTGSCSVLMASSESVTASFALVPTLELTSLTLSTADVAGCKSVTGTVKISQPAPSAGVVITLGDTLASASTAATLKIASGGTKKTFKVTTLPVETEEAGTVSATLGDNTISQPLSVRPIGMYSVTLSPTSVVGGLAVIGTAKLECAAGPGPVTVELASSKPGAASPAVASIVLAKGVQSAPFDVTTYAVLVKTSTSISATANARSKSKTLTVSPAASVSPTSLKFGYVTINTTSPVLSATLYNKGIQPYSIVSIGLTGTSAKYFAQTSDCPGTLDAGASCTIGVTFTPTVTGSKTAKVTIANGATATPLSVSLSGTGISP